MCDANHVKKVARIVADTYRSGRKLAVVVSAMGESTDELIELAGRVNSDPDPRELDVLLATGEQVSIAMLALALQSLGLKARSFTGPQAGIITDDTHGFARIKTVQASRIEESLLKGEIAVVAGFQGMNRKSELTTLGRGGSDTTAVALAAALKAECCDIYTDVNGIYTSDPRRVGNARRLHAVSYEEMLALASLGAQVLNARSVELAMKKQVPVRLRSTFEPEDTGTLVTNRSLAPEYQICGVACDNNRLSMRLVLGQNFSTAETCDLDLGRQEKIGRLICQLEEIGIAKSAVVCKKSDGLNISEILLSCESRIARQVQAILAGALSEFPASQLRVETAVAAISLIGNGVHADKQVLKDLLQTLSSAEIPVSMLTADKLSISALVPERFKDDAVSIVHDHFCRDSRVLANNSSLN